MTQYPISFPKSKPGLSFFDPISQFFSLYQKTTPFPLTQLLFSSHKPKSVSNFFDPVSPFLCWTIFCFFVSEKGSENEKFVSLSLPYIQVTVTAGSMVAPPQLRFGGRSSPALELTASAVKAGSSYFTTMLMIRPGT